MRCQHFCMCYNHHHDLSNCQSITSKIHVHIFDKSESEQRCESRYGDMCRIWRLKMWFSCITHHVVTATVLFDDRVAFGTALCILCEVFNGFVVVVFLPILHQITWYGIVWLVAAIEAKVVATLTRAILSIGQQMIGSYGQVTARWWAPTKRMSMLFTKKWKKNHINILRTQTKLQSLVVIVLTSTKLLVIKCWYFCRMVSSVTNCMTVTSSTAMPHLGAGQQIECAWPSSDIFIDKYWRQQSLQYSWPQPSPTIS